MTGLTFLLDTIIGYSVIFVFSSRARSLHSLKMQSRKERLFVFFLFFLSCGLARVNLFPSFEYRTPNTECRRMKWAVALTDVPAVGGTKIDHIVAAHMDPLPMYGTRTTTLSSRRTEGSIQVASRSVSALRHSLFGVRYSTFREV